MADPQHARPKPSADTKSTDSHETVSSEIEWNYIIGIKLFQCGEPYHDLLLFPKVNAYPPEKPVPGYLCQAARALLGLSQSDLRELSMVSKKSINDYENAFSDLSEGLALRLRQALEGQGARFVHGDGATGVVTGMARSELDRRSRSPRKNEAPSDRP
ncbi:helix-turn-helix transcriptional regulator [Methylorubrum populi]|jgi:DNA-binding XRE family transcriptional regulator|uniref:Helix-turn-helix domain-containing protein n=3 Tax=Methylobacteriaceae TaxID=119045 RepID=A0ABW1WN58_9HYPH|nr:MULTISPECIES: helix-turn-helix transcriptional regulator [Methylobacteriaceae]GJE36555.1 hypothetical protein KHHGKMAE_0606 [Methylobacterium persicinum]MCP1541432.1 DNA-binding XRE family transcriptional regulator [Methylorubrum extorquens]MCP1586032.1 DNA-binding XRE family transcriptional regulator [Methylorubrum extorquens]GJD91563.1 hypothetical protein BHAOGJBA_5111 [Methylobacterium hispanicum]GJE26566.1 hypothetical protein LKMONMHP_1417 [Methylobacterium organophilum]